MARALGPRHGVRFLVPCAPEVSGTIVELAGLGEVITYPAPPGGFPASTAAAVWRARRVVRANPGTGVVLFCDAHLPVLLLLAATGRLDLPGPAAIVLQGPERTLRGAVRRRLLHQAMRRSRLSLYCRTDELTTAWQEALGSEAHRVATLPSLELSRLRFASAEPHSGPLRLGILGQIRAGKGIERVGEAVRASPEVELTIAGPFASAAARRRFHRRLTKLGADPGNLTEGELVTLAGRQDYILLLYDDWDARMESGIFYVAAAVGRPVVTYPDGWCGRQVRSWGCGVVLERDGDLAELKMLPGPGSSEYEQLCTGMRRFATHHAGPEQAARFLDALGLGSSRVSHSESSSPVV
jgi:hypothetical protein